MQPDILNHIKNNLIIVDLITDYKNELPEKDQYYSEALEKDVVNTGLLACDIQITKFNTNSQPFWVLLTPSGSEIRRISYTSDPNEFRKFLFSE
jgi:thiol:disulfide interchange protein DsbD